MKPRNVGVVEQSGSMVDFGEDIELSLDINSLRDIVRYLTDMYANPALAAVREYATNALDSHIAAGNRGPVLVSLPTDLRPTYIVQDFGKGMSYDEIKYNFSKYGLSTKKDSDAVAGMLGLGCKSGLTYASQFSLVAVKNGIRTTILMIRGTDHIGRLKVLDTCKTDEPNGVTVEIPVSNVAEFNRHARQFFRFWEPGTVLVDDEIPASFFADEDSESSLQLDPDVRIVTGLHSSYVVMGSVPYEARIAPAVLKAGVGTHVVVRVAMGMVDFPPSRESLMMTPRTTELVEDTSDFVSDRLHHHIQMEIDGCETPWEALQVVKKWSQKTTLDKFTYKGEKIPSSVRATAQHWTVPRNRGGRYSKAGRQSYIEVRTNNFEDCLIVYGFPHESLELKYKVALIEYRRKRAELGLSDFDNVYVVSSIGAVGRRWLEGVPSISFSELRENIPKKVRRSHVGPVEKWLVRPWESDSFRSMEVPNEGLPIVYILKQDNSNINQWSGWTREEYRYKLGSYLFEDLKIPLTLVMVSKSHLERFLKQYSQAQTLQTFIETTYDRVMAQLPDDALSWGVQTHPLDRIDLTEIKDKSVRQLGARIQAVCTKHIQALLHQRTVLNQAYTYIIGADSQLLVSRGRKYTSDIQSVARHWWINYPMLEHATYLKAPQIDYLNAMYYYRRRRKSA